MNHHAMGPSQRVDGPVSHGLNLTLELRDPAQMPDLLKALALHAATIRQALMSLNYVHFARFLPTRDQKALLVITEFDGDFESYVMDFALTIGAEFSLILSYVANYDPKHLPVGEHPAEFWEFIQKNSEVTVGSYDISELLLFSAYPDKTVLDILGPRRELPQPVSDASAPASIDLANIQGNILRGYHAKFARHFSLVFDDAARARRWLALMVDTASGYPQITTGQEWVQRPDYFANIGLTHEGLAQLGVPASQLALFPPAFVEGPAQREPLAMYQGHEESAPYNWVLGEPGSHVHALLSLYADTAAVLDTQTAVMRVLFAEHRLRESGVQDAASLPDDCVHFGYREGMGQPRIAGVHDASARPDMQPLASVGEFVLGRGYQDVFKAPSIGRLPPELAQDASYAAVRILAQDVAAFEHLLDEASLAHGIDRELVAAKLMGRWRDGTPLSSGAPSTGGAVPAAADNNFNFAPTFEDPGTVDDFDGARCPVGSHIRRMNPRSAQIAGKPHTRRIIRRGMPYGPAWTAGDPTSDAGVERGLFGLFICADLSRQFEFPLLAWANGDIAASGLSGTQDPIIGAQFPAGEFRCPLGQPAKAMSLPIPRLTRTRGSLYLFLPGIAGLRYLASLTSPVPALDGLAEPGLRDAADTRRPDLFSADLGTSEALRFDPATFDPKDPGFLQDPYPYYAAFRALAPQPFKVAAYDSYWVFHASLIQEVCARTADFLKDKSDVGPKERGLFTMDPPDHTAARATLNPLFADATVDAAPMAQQMVATILTSIKQLGPRFDLVNAFADRLAKEVFFALFGVPQSACADIAQKVETVFKYHDWSLPPLEQEKASKAVRALAFKLALISPLAANSIMARMRQALNDGQISCLEHYAGHASSFAIGGYLSTRFLISSGSYHLLKNPGAWAQLQANPSTLMTSAINEMMRFDAPLQMADRYAAKDMDFHGVTLKKDDRVTLVYGSANREAGSSPDSFDIARGGGPGFAFGEGIHYCIAHSLVYKVATAAFTALLSEMPNLALEQEPARVKNPYYRSLEALRVRF